jgi:ABC-type sugar transport system substrate-binding protein
MSIRISRRRLFHSAAGVGVASIAGCERVDDAPRATGDAASYAHEEYIWLSANANLPLFAAHDHVALRAVASELGVKVKIAGPDSIDIPKLVAEIEQTAARRPAGMMVVGWDPSALVGPINQAIAAGIPVVCVDADVPASKRLAFIGTDWHDLGVQQGQAMLKALAGRKGDVALIGLIDQTIDQQAFAGFRSVVQPAGLNALEPQHDDGNQIKANSVASGLIQGRPNLVGIAGFDSESGPGAGLAVKEARKAGQIVVTCVDAEPQHLQLVKQGVITAAVGQKRELFTYLGVKTLFEVNRARVKFTSDDKKAGIVPIAVRYDTGTYTVTKDNVDLFL